VGNLLPAKGHQHLVEAATFLLHEFPDARIVIVGRSDANEPPVRERIASLGLEQHVLLAASAATFR